MTHRAEPGSSYVGIDQAKDIEQKKFKEMQGVLAWSQVGFDLIRLYATKSLSPDKGPQTLQTYLNKAKGLPPFVWLCFRN